MPENESPTWAVLVKNLASNLLVAGVVGFIGSYIAMQANQYQTEYRLQALEKKNLELTEQMAKVAEASQNNAFKLQDVSIRNGVLVEQMTEIKRQHDEWMRRR